VLTGTENSIAPGCESKGEVGALGTIGVADAYGSCVFPIFQNWISEEKEVVRAKKFLWYTVVKFKTERRLWEDMVKGSQGLQLWSQWPICCRRTGTPDAGRSPISAKA